VDNENSIQEEIALAIVNDALATEAAPGNGVRKKHDRTEERA